MAIAAVICILVMGQHIPQPALANPGARPLESPKLITEAFKGIAPLAVVDYSFTEVQGSTTVRREWFYTYQVGKGSYKQTREWILKNLTNWKESSSGHFIGSGKKSEPRKVNGHVAIWQNGDDEVQKREILLEEKQLLTYRDGMPILTGKVGDPVPPHGLDCGWLTLVYSETYAPGFIPPKK